LQRLGDTLVAAETDGQKAAEAAGVWKFHSESAVAPHVRTLIDHTQDVRHQITQANKEVVTVLKGSPVEKGGAGTSQQILAATNVGQQVLLARESVGLTPWSYRYKANGEADSEANEAVAQKLAVHKELHKAKQEHAKRVEAGNSTQATGSKIEELENKLKDLQAKLDKKIEQTVQGNSIGGSGASEHANAGVTASGSGAAVSGNADGEVTRMDTNAGADASGGGTLVSGNADGEGTQMDTNAGAGASGSGAAVSGNPAGEGTQMDTNAGVGASGSGAAVSGNPAGEVTQKENSVDPAEENLAALAGAGASGASGSGGVSGGELSDDGSGE